MTTTMELSDASMRTAGVLLLTLVAVESGGVLLLRIATGRRPVTRLQHQFFRAGHAHAGMFVTLALVTQLLVDAAALTGAVEWLARFGVAWAAVLMPAGFFLSVVRPRGERPNRLVLLVPAGAGLLAVGVVSLGVGLLSAA